MPLRHLIYVTKILQGITRNADLYGSILVKIPTPRFVVFYNGVQKQPEQKIWRLSDAFEKQVEKPELELAVTMYNINAGNNPQLLEACRTLKEYAEYVQRVRENARRMPFEQAVEAAVDMCIKNGILKDFLLKNRAEAIAMSIFEYDEEKHLKSEREYAYNKGRAEGRAEGKAEGRAEGKAEGRAEGKAEGRAEGKAEGRAEGKAEGKAEERRLLTFLLQCSKQGDPKEAILQKLQKTYSLSKDEAESYYAEVAGLLI